jgi:IPT/TIG domain
MELRARIRPLSRRAAFAAALVALVASAVAGAVAPSAHAAKKTKAPVITKVSPLDVAVGETLTIRGRNFITGRDKNTVVFKRDGARAVFVKAAVGTKKLLRVTVPASVQKQFLVKAGNPVPTRFRLRVLTKKLGKRFTSLKRSPLISGPRPPKPVLPDEDGDCDSDGTKNGVDGDDDNDLLADVTEKAIGTDPCKLDTDGDAVEDGYEYQSAKDLNDDEYQGDPNQVLPYPGKRPYPNPLYADAGLDYDGDVLTLSEEQSLWKYTYGVNHSATRTLDGLSYSDGSKHSINTRVAGRRSPALAAAGYDKHQQFLNWATSSAYLTVLIPVGPAPGYHDLRDANMNSSVSAGEALYFDFNGNSWLADDERDDETHGRMTPEYWTGCYSMEKAYGIGYAGPKVDDADSDGDGVLDGADDQDHDDVPNLMELSRYAASGHVDWQDGSPCRVASGIVYDQTDLNGDGKPDNPNSIHPLDYGRVNPFNPCLPATNSRTCVSHPSLSGAGAPFDDSPNWLSLQ